MDNKVHLESFKHHSVEDVNASIMKLIDFVEWQRKMPDNVVFYTKEDIFKHLSKHLSFYS